MATPLIHPLSVGSSAGWFQLATPLGIVDLLLVCPRVDPSFLFCVYWVFIYLLALSHHPLYALHCILCGIFTVFIYHVSGLLLYKLISLFGWVLLEVKGPLPRSVTYRLDECSCRIPHPVVCVRRH